MCSGVVLCDEVHWVTFHSGYDFGYIIKLLTCKPLPADEDEFFAELLLYCPHVSPVTRLAAPSRLDSVRNTHTSPPGLPLSGA